MFIPISYSVRSLFVRKATTIATVLGIGLVVFVLSSSLMLSNGLKKTLGSTGKSDRALVIRKGSDNELSSSVENPTIGVVLSAPGVKKEGSTPVGTSEIIVVLAIEKLGTDGKISNLQVRGVGDQSFGMRKELKIIQGRRAQPGTDEAVIGRSLVGRFKGMELGQSFDLRKGRPVKVVGVFDSEGSAFDSEAWVDLETLRSSFGRSGVVSSVLVQLESPAAFEGFQAAVEHDKQLGLEAFRETAYYEKQSEGTSLFINALGITVAIIFSIGAMIGAMITMYAAVGQRGKEIGTLKALGFSNFSILSAFLLESTILAVIGGAAGAAASSAMGFIKFSMMNFATWQELTFSFEPSFPIILTSLVAGSMMGILGGFFPALRAALLPPIVAMRG